MDEDQYRAVYRQVNERKCVFEKAINARRCNCSRAQRLQLADREAVACTDAGAHARCGVLLPLLRQKAAFALRLAHVDGPLPHAAEIRVQAGGLTGIEERLRAVLPDAPDRQDIKGLIDAAESCFGGVEAFPYSEIVKAVTRFEGRRRRRRPDSG